MSGTMEARGILELVDLTLLDRSASEEDIASVCRVANEQGTAAVCVFPEHAQSVRRHLEEGISVAVVAGGFPEGDESPEDISLAISEAVSCGADEIDCVLEPRDSGDFPGQEELAKLIAMREASSGLVLKVIVETPMLGDRQIRAVARMAPLLGRACRDTGGRGEQALPLVRGCPWHQAVRRHLEEGGRGAAGRAGNVEGRVDFWGGEAPDRGIVAGG